MISRLAVVQRYQRQVLAAFLSDESFRAALRTASTEPLVLPRHDAAWGAWVT